MEKIEKTQLIETLSQSGIVGLGGAVFPTHMKLKTNQKQTIHTLVINAAECEPFITCDDMLMRERADEIIRGSLIAQTILGAEKCVIGIEDNKIEAYEALKKSCSKNDS